MTGGVPGRDSKRMHPTLVILVVGLTRNLIGEQTPHLKRFLEGGESRDLEEVTPAVTCSVQATFMTGLLPEEHGIVANGWKFRDTGDVAFWKQSRSLIQGETIWDRAKRLNPAFTSARMFWWYNMHDEANEWSATPRPQYPSDGRKIPDIWTNPPELRDELQAQLGTFPLFHYWGPTASIKSTEWITEATLRVFQEKHPTLTLTYLPHLDYNLQRLGPHHPDLAVDLRAVDAACGKLIEAARKEKARVLILSEYGIAPVRGAVHINRELAKHGFIRIRQEEEGPMMDPAGSAAFAVVDHQLAHVYIKNPDRIDEVRNILENLEGVDSVYRGKERKKIGLDHERSGELVALAQDDRWFSYYYWPEEVAPPDFARTVDIHKKPGYDPVELFVNPEFRFPRIKIASILLRRKLGFRTLLDVTGTDTDLIGGSHGRPARRPEEGSLLISSEKGILKKKKLNQTDVKGVILDHVFGPISASSGPLDESLPEQGEKKESPV